MDRPSRSLKFYADSLARQLSSDAGSQVARLLRMLLFPDSPSLAGEPVCVGPDGRRVGIWERGQSGGEAVFTRMPERRHEWHLWANVGQISLRAKGRRVVFLGESAARGYLYDPAYNPATVLARILESRLGGEDAVEVVDLARTSIGMDIKELAMAAAALRPDVIVLFCGNNWRYEPQPGPLDAGSLAGAIRERGAAGHKEHAEAVVRLRSEQVVDEVSAYYAEQGIPLVWIAPEFNLGDWRDPVASAPHLAGDGNRLWLACQITAKAALAAGDYQAAAEAASRMIELDLGADAAGYYILAECAQAAGDVRKARSALESARDAHIWDTSLIYAPRSTSAVLGALRERSAEHGDLLVDSAAIFHEHLKGEIPDRRIFLDYCHLTSEGIRVTMAAVASAVLPVLGQGADSWQVLLPEAPRPPARVESETFFLAAIHNAHWWQDSDVIEHYISEAINYSEHIAAIMPTFLELQARRAPLLMCGSAEKILRAGSPQIQHYLFTHNYQCLDRRIAGAITRQMRMAGAGEGVRVERLWVEEHSIERRRADLLDYYYLSAACQAHEAEWVRPGVPARGRNYYKAFSPRSRFCFVGEAGHPVALDLTWRIPHPPAAKAEVLIYLNDHQIGGMLGGSTWQRHEISIPGTLICEGLNEIAFEWPLPEFPGAGAIERISQEIAAGKTPDLYCSYGEVHAFTAYSGTATKPSGSAQARPASDLSFPDCCPS